MVAKLSLLQQRLLITWGAVACRVPPASLRTTERLPRAGTLRVAAGMSLGQFVFDHARKVLGESKLK